MCRDPLWLLCGIIITGNNSLDHDPGIFWLIGQEHGRHLEWPGIARRSNIVLPLYPFWDLAGHLGSLRDHHFTVSQMMSSSVCASMNHATIVRHFIIAFPRSCSMSSRLPNPQCLWPCTTPQGTCAHLSVIAGMQGMDLHVSAFAHLHACMRNRV